MPLQVYVQVYRPGMDKPLVLHGVWVLVTKCPCLHPGDIRVLRAVATPGLSHLVNCVVFPRNVSRCVGKSSRDKAGAGAEEGERREGREGKAQNCELGSGQHLSGRLQVVGLCITA